MMKCMLQKNLKHATRTKRLTGFMQVGLGQRDQLDTRDANY